MAPALFDRAEPGVELGYQPDDVTAGRAIREKVSLEQALADVEAAAKEVAGAGRIGVVGYCWGGTVAWVAATRSRTFAAAISYYGGGVPDLAGEQPNCPVQLHFGEQDHAIPLAGVEKLKARTRSCRSTSTRPGTASTASSAPRITPRAPASRASARSPSCASTSADALTGGRRLRPRR